MEQPTRTARGAFERLPVEIERHIVEKFVASRFCSKRAARLVCREWRGWLPVGYDDHRFDLRYRFVDACGCPATGLVVLWGADIQEEKKMMNGFCARLSDQLYRLIDFYGARSTVGYRSHSQLTESALKTTLSDIETDAEHDTDRIPIVAIYTLLSDSDSRIKDILEKIVRSRALVFIVGRGTFPSDMFARLPISWSFFSPAVIRGRARSLHHHLDLSKTTIRNNHKRRGIDIVAKREHCLVADERNPLSGRRLYWYAVDWNQPV